MSKEYYDQLITDPRVVLSPNNDIGKFAYHAFNTADNYKMYIGARTQPGARYDDLHTGRYLTSSLNRVKPMLEDPIIRQNFEFVIIPADQLDVSVHMYEYNKLTKLDAVANTSMYNQKIHTPPEMMAALWPEIDQLLLEGMSNESIANQVGVSTKPVSNRRKKLGIEPTINYKRLTQKQFDDIDHLLTTTDMTYRDIAKKVGVGIVTVFKRRKKLGIAPKSRGRGNALTQDKYDLIDRLLTTTDMSNRAIGREAGVSYTTVRNRRTRLGIEPVKSIL